MLDIDQTTSGTYVQSSVQLLFQINYTVSQQKLCHYTFVS